VLATVLSSTIVGLDGRVIRVEVDVAPGLPGVQAPRMIRDTIATGDVAPLTLDIAEAMVRSAALDVLVRAVVTRPWLVEAERETVHLEPRWQ
jgi:hypothetical protein